MNFHRRNFLHILVKGQQEKLLPVVIHISDQDLPWFNEAGRDCLQLILEIVTAGIEAIEMRSRIENSADPPTRLDSPGGLISLSFITKSRKDFSSYSVLNYSTVDDAIPRNCGVSSFEVIAWAFRADPTNSYVPLPTDEV
jgi:hypothetical protein